MHPEFVFIKCGKHHSSCGGCPEGRHFCLQFSGDQRHSMPFRILWTSSFVRRQTWARRNMSKSRCHEARQVERLCGSGPTAVVMSLHPGCKGCFWFLVPR